MAITFPDPFSDSIVEQVLKVIEDGEAHDLTIALDAQINSQMIPEWYQTNAISRIYSVLLDLRTKSKDRVAQEKVNAMLKHMKKKYKGRINPE